MQSVSKHRKDYKLTYKEVEQLTRASHAVDKKEHALVLARKVWKRIGEELGFYYETVSHPVEHDPESDVRWFSAIPKDVELTKEEAEQLEIDLDRIQNLKTED